MMMQFLGLHMKAYKEEIKFCITTVVNDIARTFYLNIIYIVIFYESNRKIVGKAAASDPGKMGNPIQKYLKRRMTITKLSQI